MKYKIIVLLAVIITNIPYIFAMQGSRTANTTIGQISSTSSAAQSTDTNSATTLSSAASSSSMSIQIAASTSASASSSVTSSTMQVATTEKPSDEDMRSSKELIYLTLRLLLENAEEAITGILSWNDGREDINETQVSLTESKMSANVTAISSDAFSTLNTSFTSIEKLSHQIMDENKQTVSVVTILEKTKPAIQSLLDTFQGLPYQPFFSKYFTDRINRITHNANEQILYHQSYVAQHADTPSLQTPMHEAIWFLRSIFRASLIVMEKEKIKWNGTYAFSEGQSSPTQKETSLTDYCAVS